MLHFQHLQWRLESVDNENGQTFGGRLRGFSVQRVASAWWFGRAWSQWAAYQTEQMGANIVQQCAFRNM